MCSDGAAPWFLQGTTALSTAALQLLLQALKLQSCTAPVIFVSHFSDMWQEGEALHWEYTNYNQENIKILKYQII